MSTFNVVLSFCAVFCYLYRVVSYDTWNPLAGSCKSYYHIFIIAQSAFWTPLTMYAQPVTLWENHGCSLTCSNQAPYSSTTLSLSLSLSPFRRPFSRWTWISWYQNVSIVDFIGAKGDGDRWRWQLESNRNHQLTNAQLLQAECPSFRPTNTTVSEHWKETTIADVKLCMRILLGP